MKVLAVDTATSALSVAVVENSHLLAETTLDNGLTHAVNLMGVIDSAMKWAGVELNQLDGLAVVNGPGSFTGLRIGISCVKGLAEAHDLPVVAVSSLQALAFQAASMAPMVCPVLDARKKEVYFAFYRTQNGVFKKRSETKVGPVTKLIEMTDGPCLFLGDGSRLYAKQIQDGLKDDASFAGPLVNIRRAATVAALGMEGMKNNKGVDGASIKPVYIRQADAKLNPGRCLS